MGAVLLSVLHAIFGLILPANVYVAALSLPIVLRICGVIGGIILIVVSLRVWSMAPQEAAA